MQDILDKITAFADEAHGEQLRKYTPERYIVHPVRIMEMCRKYTMDIAVLAAALLHDVLEDTRVTKEEIYEFLKPLLGNEQAQRALRFVEELTDVYVKKNYPKWNRRKRKTKEAERLQAAGPEAQTIKYADIIDNASEITVRDPEFAERYLFECKCLLKRMTRGDGRLREHAIQTVNANLASLRSGTRKH